MILCPHCQTSNKPIRRFCRQCGASLEVRCSRCGFVNDVGDKFCGGCGQALVPEAGPAFVPAPTRVEAPPPPAPAPVEAPPKATEMVEAPSAPSSAEMALSIPQELLERQRQAAQRLEGSRRTVTVLMAEIGGFEELRKRCPQEQAAATMNQVFTRLARHIFEYEGYIDKFVDDMVMALFGAPLAHEDAPERALRAVLQMREEIQRLNASGVLPQGCSLRLRAGVNTGTVVVGGVGAEGTMSYTAMGDTVNLASRLQTAAQWKQILISHSTYQRVKGSFEIRALEPIRVKGKRNPVQVYEVLSAKRRLSRLEASLERGWLPFTGRQEELAKLEEAYGLMLQGQGQVVGIVGEAGIGKSRLVYELMQRASEETLFFEGRCLSYGRHFNYLPFADILRAIFGLTERETGEEVRRKMKAFLEDLEPNLVEQLPYLGNLLGWEEAPGMESLSPEERRQRNFEAFLLLLLHLRRRSPVVLVLDDLQWIDPSSQELLNYLVDQIPGLPILILGMYRPDYLHPWGNKSYYRQINLTPLSPAEARRILDALLGVEVSDEVAEVLIERANGNPYFLDELTRSLEESGAIDRRTGRLLVERSELKAPESVEEILLTRIDSLEEATRQVLQCASLAVVGQRVKEDILRHICPVPHIERHLMELQRQELLTPLLGSPEREFLFRNALVQEVAYHTLLISRRQELHRQVGRFIEEHLGAGAEMLDVLAYHYGNSDDLEKKVEYLWRKAQRDWRNGLNPSRTLSRVVEALEELGEEERWLRLRLEVLRLQGRVFYHSGDPKALEVFQQMLALAERLGDRRAIADASYNLATQYTHRGAFEEAREAYTRVLAMDEEEGNLSGMATTYVALGNLAQLLGEYEEALENFQRALRIHQEIGDSFGMWLGYNNVAAMQERLGAYQEALESCEAALELVERAREEGEWPYPIEMCEAYTVGNLARAYVNLGQYLESLPHQMKTLEAARGMQSRPMEVEVLCLLSRTHLHLGHPAQALRYAEEAELVAQELGEQGQKWLVEAKGRQAAVHLELHQLEKAHQALQQGLAVAEGIDDRSGESFLFLLRGQYYARLGQWQAAQEDFQRALEQARQGKSKHDESLALSNLALALIPQGRYEEALEMAHRAIEIAQQLDARRLLALGYLRKAQVLYEMGRFQEARPAVTTALVLAEAIHNPDVIGAANGLLARCLEQEGQPEAALDALAKAVEALEEERHQLPADGDLQERFLSHPERRQIYSAYIRHLIANGEEGHLQQWAQEAGLQPFLEALSSP